MSSTNPVSSSSTSSSTANTTATSNQAFSTNASTTSNSSTGISSLGVGSGLDLNGIIDKLVAIQKQPLTKLQDKQKTDQDKLSALGVIQNNIFTLQNSLFDLKNEGRSSAITANSSNTDRVTATTNGTAVAAAYNLNIINLAKSQSIAATGQASTSTAIGASTTSTITIDFGTISGGSFAGGVYTGASYTQNSTQTSISFTIDSNNNTLQGIRDAINSATGNNGRVTASIVNDGSGTPYRLSITSASGVDNSLRIGVAGDATLSSLLSYDPAGTQNMTEQQTAQSANLTINGLAITSNSNTVSNAATGVTFNLLDTGTATITAVADNSKISDKFKAFVEAYNNVVNEINDNVGRDQLMQGDSGLNMLLTQLTSGIFTSPSNTGTSYNTLTDLGITYQKDGTLTIDEEKLDTAITDNPTQVKSLMVSYGTSLRTIASNAVGINGLISSEINSVNSDISDLAKQITQLNDRITQTQDNLRTQFAALDTLVSKFQRTSSYLTQQFEQISANSSSK